MQMLCLQKFKTENKALLFYLFKALKTERRQRLDRNLSFKILFMLFMLFMFVTLFLLFLRIYVIYVIYVFYVLA